VQDPTWREVFDYMLTKLHNGDLGVPWWLLVGLAVALLRKIVSVLWRHHRQRQQASIVNAIVTRWMKSLGKPFWTLSTAVQLDSIERLRGTLVGSPAIVLEFVVAIRVAVESEYTDAGVLGAFDRLAAEWQDKLPSARRRRYRRSRALDSQGIRALKNDVEPSGVVSRHGPDPQGYRQ
jgi:hypothetical protein